MNNAEVEQAKWNKILAKEGLSVWEGTDHKLSYVEHLPVSKSNHPRSYVNPEKSAGNSDTRLYYQLALSMLSDRDKTFLAVYESHTVPEVAELLDISVHAVHARISAIRGKLKTSVELLDKL